MKKLVVILLLIMYGASTYGMTLHFHYCCGKLKNIDFTSPKNNHCGRGKTHTMGSKPCCDNKQVEIKLKGEQAAAKTFHPAFHYDVLKPVYQQYFVSTPAESKKLVPEIFAPPPSSPQPLFILNCVFRI